ncbi:hypothetical protein ACN47E_001444 [Coniothyrium glycines]
MARPNALTLACCCSSVVGERPSSPHVITDFVFDGGLLLACFFDVLYYAVPEAAGSRPCGQSPMSSKVEGRNRNKSTDVVTVDQPRLSGSSNHHARYQFAERC